MVVWLNNNVATVRIDLLKEGSQGISVTSETYNVEGKKLKDIIKISNRHYHLLAYNKYL